ncbi:hypothetical protein SAMN05216577_12810 [Pseudomonas citronellolis]|uniref:Uncharacterized protein n=1 Tax=Pseudomonas citronellolis TaxID=53408 RepID=A0AAQ1KIY9_9PSED|nr:hypothetical protein [Pseudomonas citronellolis]TGC32404.1 hypothetical protein CW310_01915 [Pseudomonas citronellolis]SFD51765.1 hypothetical protein SAMN05216577_12810 [Pseudomonas citronellolis]
MATIEELGYALARQIPDMEGGFTVQTNYGDLRITGEAAVRMAELARSLLERQYRQAKGRATRAKASRSTGAAVHGRGRTDDDATT